MRAIVLFAPAFGFAARWEERLGPAAAAEWRTRGTMTVMHWGTGREEPRPHLLTVSPLRAAQEGVRSFRLMLQLLLHAQVPVPR